MSYNIAGILLAAGQSKRFGSNKLLHPFNKRNTIAQQSAHNLMQACPNSFAVVNDTESSLAKSLSGKGLQLIENKNSIRGIGSSIACGVKSTPDADAWLIVLADMPYLKAETIKNVIQNFIPNDSIIAATYQKKQGHPVLFSKYFYNLLIQLNNDFGAKNIIKNNKEYVFLVETGDPGVLHDIDLPENLQV